MTFVVQRFRSGCFGRTGSRGTARDTVVLFGTRAWLCRSRRMTTAELRRTNRARQQSASEGRFLKGYREEPLLREGRHHGCYATRFREGFGDCRGDGGDRQALFHGQPPSSSGWIVRTKEGRPRNFFGSRPAWRIIPRFSPGGAAPRPARIPRSEYGDPDKRKPAGAGRPRFRDWCRHCRSGRRPAPPYCAGSGP